MKLSAPQQRALQAASDGLLMHAYPQFTGGGWWIKDVWPMREGNVRPQTAEALCARGLLSVPPREPGKTATLVHITAAGKSALASRDINLTTEETRRDG